MEDDNEEDRCKTEVRQMLKLHVGFCVVGLVFMIYQILVVL